MNTYNKNERNTVKRVPKRGHYDKKTVYEVLDAGFVCQVAFVIDGQPFIIPTIYGRSGDTLYLHGSVKSRMMTSLEEGIPVCINVTFTDGIVLARSAFHHSLNYRSVTVFGKAKPISTEQKNVAFKVISDQILKGRWEEARQPTQKEMDVTSVLAVEIEDAAAKIRTGPPADDKADLDLPIWGGVVPMTTVYGTPIPDDHNPADRSLPDSVKHII
ncbi:MAG: pyridoxamine 5'-phosphate oxidase family protein [Bacteroidetes bacterium]|nr:MAG: pyridoxamine 5'-phosphate oxidase family protein [Bacteroidota bacterium]